MPKLTAVIANFAIILIDVINLAEQFGIYFICKGSFLDESAEQRFFFILLGIGGATLIRPLFLWNKFKTIFNIRLEDCIYYIVHDDDDDDQSDDEKIYCIWQYIMHCIYDILALIILIRTLIFAGLAIRKHATGEELLKQYDFGVYIHCLVNFNQMITGNKILSALQMNTYFYYDITENDMEIWLTSIPHCQIDGLPCACDVTTSLIISSGIYDAFDKATAGDIGEQYLYLPGISAGCFPVDSILVLILELCGHLLRLEASCHRLLSKFNMFERNSSTDRQIRNQRYGT
ncbi:hypothetical protein I4U23_010911 [Adineta vaga]|nr:hypothetical protein I4U23_010911 [Adineta vaga]